MGEGTLAVHVTDTGSADTTFTDADVAPGTFHVHRVKAINAAGHSRWSKCVDVTPQP